MAQKGAKSKITSSPSQTVGLPAALTTQAPAPPGITMADLQKMFKESSDAYNKRMDDLQKKMDQRFDKVMEEIRVQVKEGNDLVKQELIPVITALSANVNVVANQLQDIKEEQKASQATAISMEERLEMQDREIQVLQYREMEYILRLRGMKEGREEDLRQECVEAFAGLLKMDPGVINAQIQKIYRVNSWVARQRNLPRDVLVHFQNKQLRYDVAQAAYQQTLKIQGQDVRVIKEIPIRMLKTRKEYFFLTDELKKRGIPFRWEIPVGLVVSHMGRRYRLLSLDRAKEFYHGVLHAGQSGVDLETSLIQLEDNGALAPDRSSEGFQIGERQEEKLFPTAEPKEKRITRAMAKKIEKPQREQPVQEQVSPSRKQSEAMGGARPKLPADVEAMLAKIPYKKDG